MAETTRELQDQLDAAKQILSVAQKNLDNAPFLQRKFYQDALNVAQTSFDKIKSRYDAAYKREVNANQAKKDEAEAQQESKQQYLDKAQVDINTASRYLANAKQNNNQAKITQYTAELEQAKSNLAAIQAGAKAEIVKIGGTSRTKLVVGTMPGVASPVPGVDARTADRAAQQSVAERTDTEKATGITDVKTIVENGVQMQVTTYANGDSKKTPVVSSAAAGTAGVTASAGATPAATKPGKGPKVTAQVVAPSTDWEATFRSTFPSKAWLLDQDRTKYPQLFSLLQKAHDEKYYESTEGQARFAAELQGVDFYRELASSGKVREIKTIVGDLGFDSTDFSKFVTDSINFGWTGETLKAETYKEVFRRNPDGTYANPTSVKRATSGNDYLGVQLIAKNYFNSAPQSSIESVLTGGITTADFQRQQREIAKKRYGHLADLIDQGVTLEDLAGNYKQTAAKLLEIDPNSIDMSTADYEVALAFGEEGKKRAMTTGEWEKLLRTDSRYGWEKTENAKTEARSLANNLAQAFGRII
jgi:hypothetical protein